MLLFLLLLFLRLLFMLLLFLVLLMMMIHPVAYFDTKPRYGGFPTLSHVSVTFFPSLPCNYHSFTCRFAWITWDKVEKCGKGGEKRGKTP